MANPSLAARFDETVALIRVELATMIRAYHSDGALPHDISANALTGLVGLIVPGFILQLALFGPTAVAGVPEAVSALWPR